MADLLPALKLPSPRRDCPEHAGMSRILIVEPQLELRRALRINLMSRLYDVMIARTGREALALAASRGHPRPRRARHQWHRNHPRTAPLGQYQSPIIVLSGHGSPGNVIGALDAGADDCVTTPFAMGELLARLRGQLVGAAQLLTGVWGPGFEQRTNYLRFHMARLRRKLEDDPAHPRYLLTEHGMGYRYQPHGTPAAMP
ncbi:MAG: winged helix-turn-helix domain-containing protein [Trebonia sp.]